MAFVGSEEIELYEGVEIEEDEHQPPESQVDVPRGVAEFHSTEEAIRESNRKDANQDPSSNEAGVVFDLAEYLQTTFKTDQFGGEKKKVGVIFKNLTVVGEGADANSIPNLWTPVEAFAHLVNPFNWFGKKQRGTDFDILHDLTGYCKDGEMLLVLGRPGAGCSSLLRVLANQISSYKSVTGNVTYGGMTTKEFKKYKGENLYTAEEDIHYPTLTVRETLQCALECKAPHKRIRDGDSRKEFSDVVLNLLLKMFGLVKQADTIVGNEWIRGLSGGERKRLTIAEAMTARSAIGCWDCTTRGLDSASALDYIKSLRIMTSEDMFNLFDKVIVLDKGVCVYFGPTKLAKSYFEDMGFMCEPRKSTPDFLTGITNLNERKVREGFEGNVPQTAVEMKDYYGNSEVKRSTMQELQDYEKNLARDNPAGVFQQHVKDTKAKGMSKNSVYMTNIWQQIRALFKREFRLLIGDKGALIGKVISVLLYSIVYGTVYLSLPKDSEGAFARGSALFNSVLFNSLVSLSQLPNALRGRRVLQKHKTYAMYHPAAYHLAQIHIPIILAQVLLYSICSYFLFGFQRDAAHFFTFVFTLFLCSSAMMEYFRICANVSTNYFMASQLANVSLIVLLIYNGFVVPAKLMPKWFKWIYWADPMAYAFKGLFLTEMNDLEFPCSGSDVIPRGGNYNNSTFQGCLMNGNKPENGLVVYGQDYLSNRYGYSEGERVISILAVFFFWLVYIIINCLVMEFLDLEPPGYTRQVYKKGKAPKQNDASTVSKMEEIDLGLNNNNNNNNSKIEESEVSQAALTWKDMTYTVPVKGGNKILLDKVEGWIKPGQMTALMGASGAGKTTLLDVLAQRKTIGKVEGTILLDGEPLHADFERLTGYVEQMDVANPGQTVREALQFSARMRQDPSIPIKEKYEYVEKVLNMMEMSNLGDALIGDLETGWGISVEERKRLTIGMELVGRPKILFLDEPTSGLDAQSSYNIVKFIRKLADQGMPLVCTIHQPSPVLFEYFDRLLLLTHGGRTVYFGDIGNKSRTLLDYFERHAEECREDENPAEYILKVVNGKDRKHTIDWAEEWKTSHEKRAVDEELINIRPKESASAGQHREFATSGWTQMWEVYKRMNLVWWRSPTYNWGRVLNAIFLCMFGSFTFFQLGDSVADLQSRAFNNLGIVLMANSLILIAEPMYMNQRQFFRREYASKFYSWWPFAISIIITEMPYLVITAVAYTLPGYWTVGLQSTAIDGFYYFIAHVVFMWFSVSLGQAIAALCSTLLQATILTPLISPFLILFAGVIIPPQSMPTFWRSFMYNIDPFHYFLEGVITTVLNDVSVTCASSELTSFPLDPSYNNCGEYMNGFLSVAPGYIQNTNSTDLCSYCPFSEGPDFANVFGWSYSHRWRNFGILWGFFASNICLVVLFVYLFRKPKR